MENLQALILAAGKGTRMKSRKAKVLHKVGGSALIEHVFRAAQSISSRVLVVVGHQADSVKARIVETTLLTTAVVGVNRETLMKEAAELRRRQPPLRATAIAKAADRDRYLAHSAHILAERDWLGYANFIAQIAIALASVAALLKERRVFLAGAVAGLFTIIIVAFAYAIHFGMAPLAPRL